jgi:hypothetical protein
MSVSIYLTVDSLAHTPTEMGQRIGMMDECEFAGDLLRAGELRQHHRWEIAEQVKGEFSTLMVEQVLDDLLMRLDGREEAFVEIAEKGTATLQICVMSNGYPGIVLRPSQLKTIARLGVTLDLDLYCDPKDSE